MVKQEQLSPRSSSSQPDNLSIQGPPHDNAAGRGELQTLSLCTVLLNGISSVFSMSSAVGEKQIPL